MNITKEQGFAALKTLQPFMGRRQYSFVAHCMEGEEQQFFFDKMVELADVVAQMPKSYETDGMGNKAVARLHYFGGAMDFYVTEKDSDPDGEGQRQAFGWVDI